MISRNKRVIYTAIYGERDRLKEPDIVLDGVDYLCFTDSDIKGDKWKVIRVESKGDPRWTAKLHKLRPPPGYDESVWVDGSFLVRMASWEGFVDSIEGCKAMAMYRHPSRDCLYQEARVCRGIFENGEVIDKQVERYRQSGLPEHYGLWAGGIIYRQSSELVGKMMGEWKREIKGGSIRDQISLPYVFRTNEFEPGELQGSLWNNDNFLFMRE